MTSDMRRAFTVIELLVVIAVIGLLVGVLMPALNGARSSAKRTACASNLRQIGAALQVYMSANRDRFPYASSMPSVAPFPLTGPKAIRIADVLRIEIGDPVVFHCPNDVSGDGRLAPNNGLTYFQSEGSSYEYRTTRPPLAGRTAKEVAALFERGPRGPDVKVADNGFYVLRDYNNFHGPGGKPGARRYLYSDGHVSDFEN
jgi:prepilin-type N-terminal cleavage/methylation domain-containing protein